MVEVVAVLFSVAEVEVEAVSSVCLSVAVSAVVVGHLWLLGEER